MTALNCLNSLVVWSENLGLSLNFLKCSSITFTRLRSPVLFSYNINNITVKSSGDSIRDLGFILTRTLSPNKHIELICCKALKVLGFVLRSSQLFHLVLPLKILYCTLVRPIIEYGSVLWDSDTVSASASVERVQRRFLRIVSFRFQIPCPVPHDYSPVLCKLGLTSLADRRQASNISFLSNLLTGKIDSPTLLSLINFKVPPVPFHIPHSSNNFLSNSPINRLMRTANHDPSFFI